MDARQLMTVAVFAPVMAFASSATWTGNSGDGSWKTDGNWTAAHPASGSDVVTIGKAATITVDTGSTVDISYMKISGGAVTLKATDGSALRLNRDVTVHDSGLVVNSGSSLSLEVPLMMTKRMDKWFDGALTIRSAVSSTYSSDNGYGFLIGRGANVIEGTGSISIPNSGIALGNGNPTGGNDTLTLRDSAKVVCKRLWLKAASTPATIGIVQDGAETDVSATEEISIGQINGDGTSVYSLKQGTLTAKTVKVGEKSSGVFSQTGGVATLGNVIVGTGTVPGAVELSGGRMELGSAMIDAKGTFSFSGGELMPSDDFTIPDWLALSGTPTFVAKAGKIISLDPAISLKGADCVGVAGEGVFELLPGEHMLPSMTVDGGTLRIGGGATVTRPVNSTGAWKVKVTNDGKLNLRTIISRVSTPVDLELEKGGKVWFAHGQDADVKAFARSVLVAHRLVLDGVEQAKGRYGATDMGKYFEGYSGASVVVPYIWTGAGDGKRWSDGANWEGGVVPPNDWTAAVDLSRAAGRTIVLSGETRITLMAFMPSGGSRKVRISGTGPLSISSTVSNDTAFYAPADAEIELDVDLQRPMSLKGALSFIGGGKLRVMRSYPSMIGISGGFVPPFEFDGILTFSGPDARIDICDSSVPYRILTVHTMEQQGAARVVFEDGCSFDTWRILVAPSGFYMPYEIVQQGGAVNIEQDMYITRHQAMVIRPFAYTQKGGTLTVGSIALGKYYSSYMSRYPGGDFNLEGGTVTVGTLSAECNDNYFRLTGGTLNLGSGGFAKTYDTWAITERVANSEPALQLGGATIRMTASATADLPTRLTAAGGETVFDLQANNLTFTETVDGLGGFVKYGTGSLTFNGKYAAAGAVQVESGDVVFGANSTLAGISRLEVNGGRVQVNGGVESKPETISLVSSASLVLGSGVQMKTGRLLIDGVEQSGTVSFGSGTVTVEPVAYGTVWIGADEAAWSVGGNWQGNVPPSGNATADFSQTCGRTVTLDCAASLTGIVYRSAGSVTIAASGAAAFAFPDKSTITVGDGATVVIDADMTLAGYLYKRGRGKLVLKRKVFSAAPPASLTKDTSFLVTCEGETEIQGEAGGVRLWTASRIGVESEARVTIAPGAVCTNRVTVNPGWKLSDPAYSGSIVQNGGIVDMTDLLPSFRSAQGYAFSMPNSGGMATYELNAGTFVLCTNNLARAIYQQSKGTFRFIQNGGLADLSGLILSEAVDQDVSYALKSGTLQLHAGLRSENKGQYSISLGNEGRVEAIGTTELFPPWHAVDIDGCVTFATAEGVTATVPCDLSGVGTVVHEGPGTLRFAVPLTGPVGVESVGGSLVLDAPIAATNVAVGGEIVANASAAFGSETRLRFLDDGVLRLNVAGETVVRELFVDGARCSAGTYGESVGDTCGGRIVGSGTLRVLKGWGMAIIVR